MIRKKGALFTITVVIIFVFSILCTANADNIVQTIQAYTGVRIIYNNQELVDDKTPYIINGSTYVPLRMLMDNFDKSIDFEPSTNRVIIKDKADTGSTAKINELNNTISSLRGQISKLQSENSTLSSQNTTLTAENKTLTSKVTTLTNRLSSNDDDDDDELSDIEDNLQEDYEDAGDDLLNDDEITVSISVSGDEDDVELEVELDFSDSNDNEEMKDISYTTVKNMLRKIYNDLKDELEDSDDYEDADLDAIMTDDEDNELEYNGTTFDPTSW